MLFSEVYGSYFNVVAKVIEQAIDGTLTDKNLYEIVSENAFSESVMNIPTALKSGEWKLITPEYNTPIKHKPTMPLTTLEKRWLKSLLDDPRIKLFDVSAKGLEDVETLYNRDTFVYFDKYSDGDDFENPEYIRNFRTILNAIKEKRKLIVRFKSHRGKVHTLCVIPHRLESMKKKKEISLLAKWLPSVNASNKETVKKAKKLSRMLGMSEAEYRKTLSELRSYLKLIENNLRERDYTFDYSKVPSKAMHKYIKAFYRNDNNRYSKYIASVERGEAKMNTSTLMPYELIEPYIKYSYYNAGSRSFMRPISEEEKASLNAAWNSLSDFCNDENALAVIDTSGSMYCTQNPMPASVALSLGLYFAEHNKGAFKNHFIEFSAEPRLIEIKGETFADKLRYVASFNEIGNTNLQSVFELLLKTATKNNIPQEEMPSKLYIISDMEFDGCIENADITNFEYAKSLFEQNGYKLPEVIFWNVESRNTQQPVKQNEQGVALVSGCTPRLFSMITSGELSPYKCMMEIIGSERYLKITA